MNAWGGVRRTNRWSAISFVLLALTCAACGSGADGGGRGTGLSAVVSGNIADSGSDPTAVPSCPFVAGSATVGVRGTDLIAPVEADCTFEIQGVPPGDVTLDIVSGEGTNSVTLNNVPAETVVVFVDVRLRRESTDVSAIDVQPAAPAPPRRFAIIAEPPSGDAPLAVQFSFAPDPLDGTVVEWNFGDRSAGSSDLTPSHEYERAGDYVAALTVTEPSRPPRQSYLVVRVSEPPVEEPLSVRLSARPQSGAPPLTVQFEASVFGNRPVVEVVWDFGDGSPPLTTDRTSVEHGYLRPGSFLAIVTVTDDLGRQAGNSFPVVVERSAVTVRPTAAATTARPTPTATPPVDARPTRTTTAPAIVRATPTVTAASARPSATSTAVAPTRLPSALAIGTPSVRPVVPTATAPVRTTVPTGTQPPRTAGPSETAAVRTAVPTGTQPRTAGASETAAPRTAEPSGTPVGRTAPPTGTAASRTAVPTATQRSPTARPTATAFVPVRTVAPSPPVRQPTRGR